MCFRVFAFYVPVEKKNKTSITFTLYTYLTTISQNIYDYIDQSTVFMGRD